MRNRLSFFLIPVLSVMTIFVFASHADAQWQRVERKNDKQARAQVRRDNRSERVIVVNPSTRVYKNDSYYRNDRYIERNNYGNILQIARLNGYEDGLHEGSKDARDGDRYDPFREHDYEDGAEGYKSRYGNRADYQQAYRQSFIKGYKEAFDRYLGEYRVRNW